MPVDWSIRHARLRIWLLCWSAIIFLVARHVFLRVSVDGGPVHVDPAIACFVLFLVYLYVLVQFLIQTRLDKRRIGQQIAKLYRAVKHVEQLQKEIMRLPRAEEKARTTAHGAAWSRSLDDAQVMPSDESLSLMRQLRDELEEFDIAAVRLELATSDISGQDGDDGENLGRTQDVDRLKAAIRDIAVLNHAFEERTTALEEAVEASRAVLAENPATAAGVEDTRRAELARRLSGVETAVQRLGGSMADDSGASARENVVWVVYLPVFVSLLLVAFSADFIAGGALSVGWRFVANIAAFRPF